MGKVSTWIKQNKVIVIIGSVFVLGGVTTAILTTCLPSYTVSNVVITTGPEKISGVAQTAGSSDESFQYQLDGKPKNGGEAPTPEFVILMTGGQALPSWLSISNNRVEWTNASEAGIYTFIVQVKADNIESLAQFNTTLSIV